MLSCFSDAKYFSTELTRHANPRMPKLESWHWILFQIYVLISHRPLQLILTSITKEYIVTTCNKRPLMAGGFEGT
jgi:hypothetical protein